MSDKVIVSKEKLNNLADSIKTLSNSSEDLTLEEMQAAVEANTEKDFELIEEFVLTEDVYSVQRTKEPDGTPYNFKELFVRLQFPNRENLTEGITLPSVQITAQINGVSAFPNLYIPSILLSTTHLTHLNRIDSHFEIRNNFFTASGDYGRVNEAFYRSQLVNGHCNIISKKSKITGFVCQCETVKFPSITSPTFKIYGIRA